MYQAHLGSALDALDARGWLTYVMSSPGVTIYGVCAVSFMMAMYALERRGRGFVLAFALGCVLSSIYGFLAGAWPFGVVELIWSGVAVQRYRHAVVVSRPADEQS